MCNSCSKSLFQLVAQITSYMCKQVSIYVWAGLRFPDSPRTLQTTDIRKWFTFELYPKLPNVCKVDDYIVFAVIGKVWMCYYNSSEDQVVVPCPLCSWERILDLLGLWVGGSRDQTSLSTVFLLFLAAIAV